MLLLLGDRDVPTAVPTVDFPLHQHSQVDLWLSFSIVSMVCFLILVLAVLFTQGLGDDSPQGSNLSRRIASLARFREKRKERCFDKKIRYTCRKELAQR